MLRGLVSPPIAPCKVAKNMNDPGLDKPISDDAKDVENEVGLEDKDEVEDEDELLQPR